MAPLEGLDPRPSRAYVKVGLSGAGDGAECLLAALVELPSRTATQPSVIAVAYADYEAAGAPASETVVRTGRGHGRHGVLLDTWGKDGGDLFHHMAEPALRAWIGQANAAGLLVALAGSLSAEGVRGAAESAGGHRRRSRGGLHRRAGGGGERGPGSGAQGGAGPRCSG